MGSQMDTYSLGETRVRSISRSFQWGPAGVPVGDNFSVVVLCMPERRAMVLLGLQPWLGGAVRAGPRAATPPTFRRRELSLSASSDSE